jgi:hypothetical protein
LIRKRREQCVILLDDCFDSASSYQRVCALGIMAERFTTHFPDCEDPELRQKSIKDPRVITVCRQHGFLLFTTDREMKKTHLEELKRSDIGVVATASNTDGVDVWVNALGLAKSRILRDFKKCERPYFSILQKSGKITTDIISSDWTNRRTRPQEKDQHPLAAVSA